MIIGNAISPANGIITMGGGLPDPISFWTADNTANDFYGNNNGTLINGATFGTGLINQAFSLDGVNDYVLCGTSILKEAEFTMSLWFKPASLPTDFFLMSNRRPPGNLGGIELGWNTSSKVYLNTQTTANSSTIQSTSSLLIGSWNNIIITFTGNTGKLYFNGVLENTNESMFAPFYDTTNTFEIGARQGGGLPADGLFDMVGFWGSGFNQTQIDALYNSGNGVQPPF